MAEIAVINKDNTDYDIRDKKLADHVSASTDTGKVSSASSIMLEASDGSFVSVKRDSFVNAIRDVLGASIVANTGGTSDVNTIPALTSSGGLKSISTANIASVLGVNGGFYARYADFGMYGSITTNISVNARDAGMAVLAFTSMNYAAGDSTCSWVHLLRFGYEGNHVSSTMIVSSSDIAGYRPQFSAASNGALVVSTQEQCNMHVALLANRPFIMV